MKKITVVGAGISGLLSAIHFARLGHPVLVVEKSEEIPNNHHAVLRFRTDFVSGMTGIPFRKVSVLKAIEPYKNPVASANSYSKKTNGQYLQRSILSGSDSVSTRYIAPPDFVSQLVGLTKPLPIEWGFGFGFDFGAWSSDCASNPDHWVINTTPLNHMASAVGIEFDNSKAEFGHRKGCVIKARVIGSDSFFSLYVPDPSCPFYRVSLTGDELMVEISGASAEDISPAESVRILRRACSLAAIDFLDCGGLKVNDQKYAKITPIDERTRRQLIMEATDKFRIISVGRFATWRPKLLLDDIVSDLNVATGLTNRDNQTTYTHKKGIA